MPTYTYEAVTALQSETTWRSAGFDRPEDAETWWFAGFHAADAQQWLAASRYVFRAEPDQKQGNHAALASLAQTFKVADFSPAQMRTWRDAFQGVDLDMILHEARRWRAAGFQPEEAQKWRQWGLLTGPNDLEFAVLFANSSWSPYEAAALTLLSRDREREDFDDVRRAWVELDSKNTLNFVKAGVSVEQAAMFEKLDMAPEILLLELRRRHEALPPLDPYLAMHLNDVFNRAFGSDPKKERPFYAEHVTDVRDTAGKGGPNPATPNGATSTGATPNGAPANGGTSAGAGSTGAGSNGTPASGPATSPSLAPTAAAAHAANGAGSNGAGSSAPGSNGAGSTGAGSNGSGASTPAATPAEGPATLRTAPPAPSAPSPVAAPGAPAGSSAPAAASVFGTVPPAPAAPPAPVQAGGLGQVPAPSQPASPFNLPVRTPGSTNIAAPPPLPTNGGPSAVVDLTDTAAGGIDIRDGGVVVNATPAEADAPVNAAMAEAMTGEMPVVRPGYPLPRKQLPDLP